MTSKDFAEIKIVQLESDSWLTDKIMRFWLSFVKRYNFVPRQFRDPSEVRRFLNDRGIYDFQITDQRSDEDLV